MDFSAVEMLLDLVVYAALIHVGKAPVYLMLLNVSCVWAVDLWTKIKM